MRGIAINQVWQHVTMTTRGTLRAELISREFIQHKLCVWSCTINHLTFIVPTAASEAVCHLWKFCKINTDIYSLRTHSSTHGVEGTLKVSLKICLLSWKLNNKKKKAIKPSQQPDPSPDLSLPQPDQHRVTATDTRTMKVLSAESPLSNNGKSTFS